MLPEDDYIEKYSYRSIQKDSIRVFLYYMPISIKQYLIQVNNNPEADAESVRKVIMRKLKTLKLGLIMLQPADMHAQGIALSLEYTLKYGKDCLERFKCFEDFKYIAQTISKEWGEKNLPLDESKLSANQGEVMQLEKNYPKYMNKVFLDELKQIEDCQLNELFDYYFPFDVPERYNKFLDQFKKNLIYGPLIQKIHIPISKS